MSEAIIRSAKNYLSRAEKAGVVDRGQQEGYNGNEWTNQLTQSQMERIWNGEGIDRIAGELPEEVQNELSRKGNELLTELTREQKRDLMFLSSGLLSGIDWETRQKILGVLKENEGRISYEDLEGMGVFKPGDLAEGGFKRWLQEHDIGGPANFDKLLSKEYELTQAETSCGAQPGGAEEAEPGMGDAAGDGGDANDRHGALWKKRNDLWKQHI